MIHPHTYIHPNAKLATNVKVDPFSVIHQNVEIGEGTWVGSNVTIMDGARIGKNCRIFPGAVIAAIPQDLKFDGEQTTVEIGDNTTIREFVTVNRGSKDRWTTRIGNNCLIMAYSHIAHDCAIGNHCIMSNNAQMAGHVTMGDYAILAGMCAIHQFVQIGQHAFVAGGSLVSKDVPPYIKAARTPLSYAGVNSVGLKRRGLLHGHQPQLRALGGGRRPGHVIRAGGGNRLDGDRALHQRRGDRRVDGVAAGL